VVLGQETIVGGSQDDPKVSKKGSNGVDAPEINIPEGYSATKKVHEGSI
jgi:hypothetical protein